MRAALVVAALAGCPRAVPPVESGAGGAPEPIRADLVSPEGAPWPSQLPPVPARRGIGDAEDLQALAHGQEIFTVEARLPILEGITSDRLASLQAALEMDPRWRVGRWGSDLVAWRRCRTAAGWHASWAGYCASPDAEWRVMLVLTGALPGDADPLEGGRFRVRTGPSEPSGWRSGTLRAAGRAVWLEIHERSPSLTLHHTASALMTLDGELEGMLRQTASPKAGWVWADAPGAEALTGERIRGELRRPQDMPPGVRPSGGWVQWDGQAPVALPPVQP